MSNTIDTTVTESNEHVQQLVTVSNRLPIVVENIGGKLKTRQSGGGLVSALGTILRKRGGLWIGWSGTAGDLDLNDLLEEAIADIGFRIHSVPLTIEEVNGFYNGFSNQVIWPLFHELQTRCNFALDYWFYYKAVNHKFAEAVCLGSNDNDFIWVHDYHLIHVAWMLKSFGVERRTGFFLHIPFPPVDIFIKLPWRANILHALLNYDLIGFQTLRDRRHFLDCLRHLIGDVKIEGRGAVVSVKVGDRTVRVGVFPIGVDYDWFVNDASANDVAFRSKWLVDSMGGSQIILGVDRLDYTKGLPERLLGFNYALRRYPELRNRITMIQLVVPSRTDVPQYQSLKAEIERLVGEINGRFTLDGWVPIHYLYRSLDRNELLAHYRAAHIGLVTPLIDGMNLVAKEYCACKINEDGVLILSEFAGAATQLHRGAILVNPYDINGVSEAIYTAFKMNDEDKKNRMRRMRDHINRQDIFWWADTYLNAMLLKPVIDLPVQQEWRPQIDKDAVEI